MAAGVAATEAAAWPARKEVIPMTPMSLVWLIDQVQQEFERMALCGTRGPLTTGRREK